ncbi:MAG: hypothetical protein AB7G15_05285 [Alphaproteobacteria bacterium]
MTKLAIWLCAQRDIVRAYPWHFGIAAGGGAFLGALGQIYLT